MATSNSLIGFTFSNRAATVWPELDKRDRRFDFLTGEKKSLFALHDVLGDGDGDGDGVDPITNPLVGGEATFENLCIDKAGDGYKIRYTLKDEYNISLGHVVGDAFNVSVGEAYQLGLIRQPHGVYGGIHWEVMPIVAVQDRGYNTITSVNNGTVSIALCVTPTADNNILISTRYSN